MPPSRAELEAQLDDFDPARRRAALDALAERAAAGAIALPQPRAAVNVHAHTFFSFNGYGYSPSGFAWRARCLGLAVAGIVDFDVLDGVDEFLDACRRLGLKGCAGIETRVYVPEFASCEINSPGEPGISYHMGMGFPSGAATDAALLTGLKATAQRRNLLVLDRVNRCLEPVAVDYERDVLPLTPNGNATERHLCAAYDLKARERFPDAIERAAFWAHKLGGEPAAVQALFADPPVFQGLIRSRTMKAGGVGYVRPEGPDFPRLHEVNRFVREAGAIPTATWLDGISEGERRLDALLDVLIEAGTAALNIIPDRNWNLADPGTKRIKLDALHRVVESAQAHALPLVVGTEMNAPGQPFVDDFESPELAPFVPAFLEGAHILYAHTLLQAHAGMGYLSPWAARHFASTLEKNAFFAEVGRLAVPADPRIAGLGPDSSPGNLLARLSGNSDFC